MAVNRISIACTLSARDSFALFPFYRDGEPLPVDGKSPCWGMSLRSAGSMRFRWNERNENRERFLQKLCALPPAAVACGKGFVNASLAQETPSRTPAFVELIHSQTVYDVPDAAAVSALCGAQGDGIISPDRSLVPVVTVADCMPLYLYDRRTGVFGAFHSGWKGTGIIGAGIALAESHYGVRREEVCVAIGAHIQDCCYVVDEERAAYFADNFTPKAVRSLHEFNAAGKRLYSLSLLEANLAVLKDAGVRSCNIVAATDCTCCTTSGGVRSLPGDAGHAGAEACSAGHAGAKIAGKAPVSAALAEKALSSYYPFGSFRREAAFMPPELTAEKRSRLMTVQAAFCIWL